MSTINQNLPQNQTMNYNWNNPTMMGNNMGQMQQPMMQQNYPMNMQNMSQARSQVYYIPGRSVNSPDEVQTYEVLMDSPMNIFPKNDRSEIYVKYWGSNGGIECDTYVKVDKNQEDAQNATPPVGISYELADIRKQLDQVLKMLKYHKPNNNRSNQNKQQKEPQK